MSVQQNIIQMRKLTHKISTLYASKVESLLIEGESCSQDVYALSKLIDNFQKLAAYEHKHFTEETDVEPDFTKEDEATAEYYIKKILEPEIINITSEQESSAARTSHTTPPLSKFSLDRNQIYKDSKKISKIVDELISSTPPHSNNNTPPSCTISRIKINKFD